MTQPSTIRPSTREAIIDAAIAVLAANPGASISEIAIKAGVGRATLHRHFRTREDLITAIQKQSIYETDKAVLDLLEEDMTALQVLEVMFKATIPLGDRYHFLFRETTTDEKAKNRYKRELDWLSSLVYRLKDEGVIGKEIPDQWAVAQLDQLVWTGWREVAAGHIAAIDAPTLALRTFTKGLK